MNDYFCWSADDKWQQHKQYTRHETCVTNLIAVQCKSKKKVQSINDQLRENETVHMVRKAFYLMNTL